MIGQNMLDAQEDLEFYYSDSIKDFDLTQAPSSSYTDNSFPTSQKSLDGANSQPALSKNVSKWARITDISTNPQLFINGVEAGDVCQGAIGNCWFIGSLSVLALKPALLSQIFMDQSIEQSRFNLKFFKDGRWRQVVIDNYLPVDKTNSLVFGHCKDDNEFWTPLVEKGYAKLNGSYKSTEYGFTQEGLVDLTGGVGYRVDVTPEDATKDKIWNIISNCNLADYLMGTMISANEKNESEFKNTGLLSGHAYGLLQCCTVNGTRLVQIRNPWGRKEWAGDWSDKSPLWIKVSSQDKKRIGYKLEEDGSFFMSYTDFCKYWTSIEICRVFFKDKYLKQQFDGAWSKQLGTSGGYTKPTSCPQYLLKIEGNKSAYVCISLLQSDKRVLGNNKSKNACIGIRVYKSPNGTAQQANTTFFKSVDMFLWDRETVLEGTFEPGQYAIVPSTHQENMESSFTFRVYSDCVFSLDQLLPQPSQNDVKYQNDCKKNQYLKQLFVNPNQRRQIQTQQEQKNYQLVVQNTQTFQQTTIKIQETNLFSLIGATDISLANNNLTAKMIAKSDAPRTCYGSITYKTGKHYFAFRVDATTSTSNIMIGVADPYTHTNTCAFLSHGPKGWAYYAYNGTIYHKFQSKNYAIKYGVGDQVGVSLDCDKGEIAFYLNGKPLGTAYTDLFGPFVAAVTLYSPQDQVTLLPNAQLPTVQSNSTVGPFKDGARLILKSKFGSYVCYTKEGTPTYTKSINTTNVFKVIVKNGLVQFFDVHGFLLTAESGNTTFSITELNNPAQNGYLLQSVATGKYLGLASDGVLRILENSSSWDSRWFPSLESDNPAYATFKQGDVISLKTCHGTYFGYTSQGSPLASTQKSADTTFTVEIVNGYFKFKSKHGFYAVCSKSDHNSFMVTQHSSGYTLESYGVYLGVTKDGKVMIYDNVDEWNTRFYPESPNVVLPKILSHGKKIAFKTKWESYFFYNAKNLPSTGQYDPKKCIFVVEQHGNYLKFKTGSLYMCTSSGNVLFTVVAKNNGTFTLCSSKFLGVSQDGRVLIYDKDVGAETEWTIEEESTIKLSNEVLEMEKQIQQLNLNQSNMYQEERKYQQMQYQGEIIPNQQFVQQQQQPMFNPQFISQQNIVPQYNQQQQQQNFYSQQGYQQQFNQPIQQQYQPIPQQFNQGYQQPIQSQFQNFQGQQQFNPQQSSQQNFQGYQQYPPQNMQIYQQQPQDFNPFNPPQFNPSVWPQQQYENQNQYPQPNFNTTQNHGSQQNWNGNN